MENELQQYLAAMEERLMDHVEGLFTQWAVPIETRARAHSATIRAIETEMEALTDRVGARGTGKLARVTQRTQEAPVSVSGYAQILPANGFTQVQEDCASALFNLGIGARSRANEAVRAASAEGLTEFDSLFKRALVLVRVAKSA